MDASTQVEVVKWLRWKAGHRGNALGLIDRRLPAYSLQSLLTKELPSYLDLRDPGLLLQGVHDLGKQEPHLRRDRSAWVCLLDQVESFIHRGKAELPVEQDDVVGVDLRARGKQLHREQVAGRRDINNDQRVA
jgi:hypothetical protein